MHQLLKKDTESQHESLEKVIDIFDRCSEVTKYAHLIWAYSQFYKRFEDALFASDFVNESGKFLKDPFLNSDYRYFKKSDLLARDIEFLKINSQESQEILDSLTEHFGPSHQQLLNFETSLCSPYKCLGSLYVIEGAQLGGAMITRKLKAQLQNKTIPKIPLSFFDGQGKETWNVWNRYLLILNQGGFDASQKSETLSAANEIFRQFECWIKASDALLASIHGRP